LKDIQNGACQERHEEEEDREEEESREGWPLDDLMDSNDNGWVDYYFSGDEV
jgi:hypothetical protein